MSGDFAARSPAGRVHLSPSENLLGILQIICRVEATDAAANASPRPALVLVSNPHLVGLMRAGDADDVPQLSMDRFSPSRVDCACDLDFCPGPRSGNDWRSAKLEQDGAKTSSLTLRCCH